MKSLKKELKNLAQNWNTSGEDDGTEFEGRYFMSDTDLDEFAIEHDLTKDDEDSFDETKIQANCDCRVVYDYAGANPNRQFGDSEIIFNSKEKNET